MAKPTKMLVFSAVDRPDLCPALTGAGASQVADYNGEPHLLRASQYLDPGERRVLDLDALPTQLPVGRRQQA